MGHSVTTGFFQESEFHRPLIRLDPVKRKGGIKARRLIAATSDLYRAQLLGLL